MAQKTNGERAQALAKAVTMLSQAHRVLILTHKSPDGDTLGSGFGLCRALSKLGKTARVVCSDPFPKKYDYLFEGLSMDKLEPDLIVACDIASAELLGEGLSLYAQKVDLCIDHHPSNTRYAGFTLVDPAAAATCELMAELIALLGVEIGTDIADCLYTGIATDTGCFRFSNTKSATLSTAAMLVERGARSAAINKKLFETDSRERLALQRMALESLEYHFDGRVALIVLTNEMMERSGVTEPDTEGIPSIPARIEGVEAGITIKQKGEGDYKISLRTGFSLNASDICATLGGGGHAAAAGCRIAGTQEEVKAKILEAVGRELFKRDGKGEGK